MQTYWFSAFRQATEIKQQKSNRSCPKVAVTFFKVTMNQKAPFIGGTFSICILASVTVFVNSRGGGD